MSRPFEAEVRQDFERARHRAFLSDVRAIIARRARDLIPYHEVRQRVSPEAESYRGVQTVRLDQIVGSMDRFQDFNRTFFPRQRFTAGRWQNVDRAYYQDVYLPPIQLYKVGDVYFVKDGNHRVSVARERGQEYIDAEVIEGHIRAPFYAEMEPNEMLLQAEYAEFLRRTDLDRLEPDHDIRPSALGRYDEIWEHIQGHRDWLSAIRHEPVSDREAVADWYQYIYCHRSGARARPDRPLPQPDRGRHLPLGDAAPLGNRARPRSRRWPCLRCRGLRGNGPAPDTGRSGDRGPAWLPGPAGAHPAPG
jgi:sarcosine oxidase delta subunit